MGVSIVDEVALDGGGVELILAAPCVEVAGLLDDCERDLALRGGLSESPSRASLISRYGEQRFKALCVDWLMETLGGEAIASLRFPLAAPPQYSLIDNRYPEGDFTFKATVFELPRGTLVSVDPVVLDSSLLSVSEDEVDEALHAFMRAHAKRVDSDENRPVEYGDTIKANVVVLRNEMVIDAYSKAELYFVVRYENMPRSFVDEVVGMRPGEAKSFAFSVPEFGEETVEGHGSYDASVKVLCLCDLQEPALSDEWVMGNVPGLSSSAGLKRAMVDYVRESVKKKNLLRSAAEDALLSRLEVNLSENLVAFVEREALRENERRLSAQGLDRETFCSLRGIAESCYDQYVRSEALRNLKLSIALDDLFRQRELVLSREDVDAVFEAVSPGDALSEKRACILKGRIHLAEEMARREKARTWLLETALAD